VEFSISNTRNHRIIPSNSTQPTSRQSPGRLCVNFHQRPDSMHSTVRASRRFYRSRRKNRFVAASSSSANRIPTRGFYRWSRPSASGLDPEVLLWRGVRASDLWSFSCPACTSIYSEEHSCARTCWWDTR
jgi:hypothetical protein